MSMTPAQISAFKAAASNVEPSLLHHLFVGVLIILLFLWIGWGLVHVYRGWAGNKISAQALTRFVIRVFLLIVITLFLFAR